MVRRGARRSDANGRSRDGADSRPVLTSAADLAARRAGEDRRRRRRRLAPRPGAHLARQVSELSLRQGPLTRKYDRAVTERRATELVDVPPLEAMAGLAGDRR